MFTSFVAGFSLGLSLILAIGAQNAFVLKQGLKQNHVFLVCSICALSDAILISLGVSGFGAMVKQYLMIETVARYAGATFLVIYAILSFKSALSENHALKASNTAPHSVGKITAMCLAFTWLNPHVYLDTVVLLGSISTQYGENQHIFGGGAVLASFVFFFSLGYGARLLKPIFENPKAWKIFESLIGFLLLWIAAMLII